MGPISWVEFQDLACPNAADAEAKAGGELWNCLAPHLEPLLLHRSPHPSLPSTGCSRRPPSRTASHMHPCISQARLSAPPQTAVPAAASASWRRARRASGPLCAPSPSQAPSCARSRGPNCRPGSRKLVLVLAACSSPTSPSLCAIRRLGTRAERPTSGAGNLKFDDTDRSGNRLRPSEGSRRRRGSCLLGRRGGPPPWPGRRACAWLRRAGGWTYLALFGHIGEGLNPRITVLLKKKKNEGLRRKPPRAGATRERRWTRGGGDGSGPDRQLISGVACPQGVGGGLASSAQGPSVHCSMNGPKKKRF